MNYQTEKMLSNLLEEIKENQAIVADAESAIADAKKKILQSLENNEIDTVTIGEEESQIKVTIVRPTTLKFNEDGLQESLTPTQWRQITKTVLDKKLLEDAVARGKVDISIVSKNSKEVASTPYLKITR
jgi:hypothetical protein